MQKFGASSFFLRFLFAFIIVFATFNPFGYSYYHWLMASFENFTPYVLLAGIVLLIGWTIYVRATLRSLGPIGLVLAFAFFGTLIWVVFDLGLFDKDSIKAVTTLVLLLFSLVLATGMSWSHIRRRLSGQVDMDDVDE